MNKACPYTDRVREEMDVNKIQSEKKFTRSRNFMLPDSPE